MDSPERQLSGVPRGVPVVICPHEVITWHGHECVDCQGDNGDYDRGERDYYVVISGKATAAFFVKGVDEEDAQMTAVHTWQHDNYKRETSGYYGVQWDYNTDNVRAKLVED